MIALEEYKKKLLEDPKLKEKYEKEKIKGEIANLILQRRKKLKLNQKKFSELYKLNNYSINKIEKLELNPRIDYLSELLLRFGYRLTITKIEDDKNE